MPVGTTYRVRKAARLTAGHLITSKQLGTVPVGTVLKATEERITATGIVRVRFANVSSAGVLQGWVSLTEKGAIDLAPGSCAFPRRSPLAALPLSLRLTSAALHRRRNQASRGRWAGGHGGGDGERVRDGERV